MAPTSEERREVAKRLRATKSECDERGYPWMVEDLLQALGFETYEDGDDGIFDRLADLIDPTCTVESSIFDDTCECESPAWGYRLSCGHWLDWGDSEPPSYCPYCGCRIDGDDGIFDRLADLIDPTCYVESVDSTGRLLAYRLSCGDTAYVAHPALRPSYCPICGARVVDEDD